MKEITEKNIEKILEAVAASTSLASLAKNANLPTYTVRYVLYKCLPKEQTQEITEQLAKNRLKGGSKPIKSRNIYVVDTCIVACIHYREVLFALPGKLFIGNIVADELNRLKESNTPNSISAQKLLALAAANKENKFIFGKIPIVTDVDTSLLAFCITQNASLVTCDAGLAVRAKTQNINVTFISNIHNDKSYEIFIPRKEDILLPSRTDSELMFCLDVNSRRTVAVRLLHHIKEGEFSLISFIPIFDGETTEKLYSVSNEDRILIQKEVDNLRRK